MTLAWNCHAREEVDALLAFAVGKGAALLKAAHENEKAAPKKIAKALAGAKGAIIVAPSFRRERALIKRGVWPVAGCDEAGRGPLAGPVVAAAVILDPDRIPR